LPVPQMHFDPASARTHVTGGEFDGVGNRRRQVDVRLSAHFIHPPDTRHWRSAAAAIGRHATNERGYAPASALFRARRSPAVFDPSEVQRCPCFAALASAASAVGRGTHGRRPTASKMSSSVQPSWSYSPHPLHNYSNSV